MAFFKKKKSEDEDLEEEYEDSEMEKEVEERRTARFKRKLKDLNPKDWKKRKEPPKPWGKKERFLILGLIIITTGISGYLALSSRNFKLPGLPRIGFSLAPVYKFFSGETIVLEGTQDDKVKEEKVIQNYKERVEDLNGVYGFYVVRLNNGSHYGVNDTEVFPAASLIKLPLMVGMYMEAEEGTLDLDAKYSLKASDKVKGAGSLYSKPVGYEITYRNLIRLMGKQSDNTAFNIVRKLLGDQKIDDIAKKIGMGKTKVADNETTPRDVGIFFEELWNGNLIGKEEKDELLEFLTDTAFEDWLPEGLPDGIRVAHKVGIETHVINDAGIVYAKHPYVIVILTKGIVEKETNNALPEISRFVYEIENGK